MNLRVLQLFALLTTSALQATVLPPPTVTAVAPPYQGTYVGANAVDQDASEFLTDSLGGPMLDFDFGSVQSITGFVNVSLQDPSRACGKHRLIFDTDGTDGFDTATDTIIVFADGQTGTLGQGIIQRFAPISARKVRWEVTEVPVSSSLIGSTEIAFLSVANGTIPVTGLTVINAATTYGIGYDATNAINGIVGKGNTAGIEYASAGLGTNAYVDFDLGAATPVTGFEMFDRLASGERTTSFNLIFSNNADMSSPVATRSYSKPTTWTASDTIVPITARYVRYDVTGGSGNTGLAEISFFKASTLPDLTVEQSFGSELTDRVIGWGERPFTYDAYQVPSGLTSVPQALAGPGYGLVRKRDGTVKTYTFTVTRSLPPNTAPSFTIPTAGGPVLGVARAPSPSARSPRTPAAMCAALAH